MKNNEFDYDERKDNFEFRKRCECERTPSCAKCEELHPCPKPVLLVCGKGLPCELKPGYPREKHECAFVEIDTTCLCYPVVKIDFCANIFAQINDRTKYWNRAKLIFKLVKVLPNGATVQLGQWFFQKELDFIHYWSPGVAQEDLSQSNDSYESYNEEYDGRLEDEDVATQTTCGYPFHKFTTQETFSCTFCECQTCPGCSVYKLIVIDESQKFVDIEIKDIQINAIAQSKC